MPSAPILTLGARWLASDVYWRTGSNNGQLLGVPVNGKLQAPANFAHQSGIYVLYSNFTPVYVGQANRRLFARLKHHYVADDLVGRWDRFSWFGFRKVVGGGRPKLSSAEANFHITPSQLLDHLEAVLIHSMEPSMNGQEGRFGRSVTRYRQVRDDRLGPTDRELLEQIAHVGGYLPRGPKWSKSGWKPRDKG